MAFSKTLIAHSAAAMGDSEFARLLPLRLTAGQRSLRMTPQDRALDWRLEVVEITKSMKIYLATNKPVPPELTKRLIILLGETD